MANEQYIPNGINVDGSKIINVATPTAPQDAVNKAYVDGLLPGSTFWTNVKVVNNIATDLPAPVAGVITLAADTTYWFNEGLHTFGTTRLVLQNGTNIWGFGKTRTFISFSGGGTTFMAGTNINSIIRDIEFLNDGNDTCFQFSNTTSFSVYTEDVNFRTWARVGGIAGGGFFARYNLIVNCVSSGFTFSTTLGSVILDTCSFRAFTSPLAGAYAVKINPGTSGTSFRCYNSIFDSALNHRGIWADGVPTLSAGGILRGNIFSGSNAVADRLLGLNGNTPNWTIVHDENAGIAGIQYVDVEVISTADASLGNPAGTYIEGTTVRGYILPIASYDPLATTMEGQITGLMTNAVGTGVQIGLRNLTTGTNIAASLGTPTEGTLVPVQSVFTAITPNNNYNAYYVKANGASTRFALKLRVKIY